MFKHPTTPEMASVTLNPNCVFFWHRVYHVSINQKDPKGRTNPSSQLPVPELHCETETLDIPLTTQLVICELETRNPPVIQPCNSSIHTLLRVCMWYQCLSFSNRTWTLFLSEWNSLPGEISWGFKCQFLFKKKRSPIITLFRVTTWKFPRLRIETIETYGWDWSEILHHQKDGWNMLKP